MKKWKKKMTVLVASLALALGLCGCALETSAENLFTLPEVPVEYTGLSNTLNTYLKSGYEYINPTGGSNMQSLQMIDLDGDGSKEAVAFFRCASDEKPLKLLFFRPEKQKLQGLLVRRTAEKGHRLLAAVAVQVDHLQGLHIAAAGGVYIFVAALQISVEGVGQARVLHRHLRQGKQVFRRGLQGAAAKPQGQRQARHQNCHFLLPLLHASPSHVSILIQNILYHDSVRLGSPCFAFSGERGCLGQRGQIVPGFGPVFVVFAKFEVVLSAFSRFAKT